jgi:Uma2 family endonuclease
MVESTPTRIKASEYYQLPEYEQHELIQLINGEVIIGMPPILKHQLLIKKILLLLAQVETQKGGVAFTAPTEVRFDENNIFEPDVLYIKPENIGIAQQDEKRIIGAPNLVVEVLSPSTARFDRQEKYHAYERHGVDEYWIVDPVHETIEVWTLGESKQFVRQGAYGKTGTFESATLGTTVTVEAIFDV